MSASDREPPRRRAGRVPRLTIAAILAGAGIAGAPAPAWARSEKTLAYPREQAWPAAVRFLAVDEHLKITEKDADAGYVMFELREEHRVFRGSLEVVMVSREGRSAVRFVLQIADRPSWVELAMLERLEDKLRAELGAPSPPPAPPPAGKPEPGKDGGKDGAADRGKDGGSPGDGPPISPTP